MTDAYGSGWRIDAPPESPLSLSAWPWTMDDLAKATHATDLKPREHITVNLDHIQMGVGGDNSWGLPVNQPYLIPARGTRSWSFALRPASPARLP